MLGHVYRSYTPIGLDVGTHAIKAVQFSRPGLGKSSAPETDRIRAAMILPRLEPGHEFSPQEAFRLAEVLDRRGFDGTELVLNVPPAMLLTSFRELPPARSGAPLNEIARVELARAHRIEPDQLEAAWWPMPDSPRHAGKGMPVMVAGCRHEQSNPWLDVLEEAGLQVRAMDLPGWALARVCQPALGVEGGMIAVVDIGWRTVQFMLLHPEGLVYDRVLGGSGLEAAVHAIHRAQDMEPKVVEQLLYEQGLEENQERPSRANRICGLLQRHFHAIARELQLSLSYAEHQYPQMPVRRVALIGGGAGIPGLDQQLSRWLEMPTQPLGPCGLHRPDDAQLANDQRRFALTPAAGLAQLRREQLA